MRRLRATLAVAALLLFLSVATTSADCNVDVYTWCSDWCFSTYCAEVGPPSPRCILDCRRDCREMWCP